MPSTSRIAEAEVRTPPASTKSFRVALRAVADRLVREGRLDVAAIGDAGRLLVPAHGGLEERVLEPVERPPLASLRAAV